MKHLKLSEVKTRNHCGRVVECRTWDPEFLSSNTSVGKNKNSYRSSHNNTTTNPTALELNTSNYRRWKKEIPVMEWKSAGLEIHRFPVQIQSVQKENLSQIQSEQYHHHPSTLELNTWNWQRWKIEITMAQWQSADLKVKRSPFQISVWAKRKSLTGPIKTIPQLFPLHHSYIPEIVRSENQKSQWYSGREQDMRSRSPQFKSQCRKKEKHSKVQSEQ